MRVLKKYSKLVESSFLHFTEAVITLNHVHCILALDAENAACQRATAATEGLTDDTHPENGLDHEGREGGIGFKSSRFLHIKDGHSSVPEVVNQVNCEAKVGKATDSHYGWRFGHGKDASKEALNTNHDERDLVDIFFEFLLLGGHLTREAPFAEHHHETGDDACQVGTSKAHGIYCRSLRHILIFIFKL